MPKPSAALLAEGFFEFKRHVGEGRCWVKGCTRVSRSDRCLCHMHDMRRWRALKNKTADYCTLRDHAKARNIKFIITLDYWRGLVDAFGYYDAPDEDNELLSIDRVDPTKGYEEGNMRVVTITRNQWKSNIERYLPEHVQHMLDRRRDAIQTAQKRYLDMDEPDDSIDRPF